MTKPTQETLREAVAPGQPKSSIDLHQRRGIMSDSILAALEEYRGYMLDDDYNAAGCLDRVVKHLERARPVAEQLEESALSLMQPEIDRRVADERAKLLERLREPSEEMLSCVAEAFYEASNMTRWESKGRAAQAFEFALVQFEKENSHEQG